MPKDIRLINSHYDDLYRIPDGGVIQVDYPDGRSFTAKLEHLDDYHFDMGGLGNVFHICQFADVMGRNHADFYPEIQTQDNQGAWELGGKGYIAIQSCDDGWDYTLYHSDFSVMDGGQVDAPELTIQEVREQILEAHHMEKGRRLLQDYDFVMDRAAEAEELGANNRHSTLEKLASLAGAKEKCDVPECSPVGCRKARDAHEL
ncbi:LPD16 domain-containing protein [Faecalibacterium prausnitzii]